jgi:hypothetical protein
LNAPLTKCFTINRQDETSFAPQGVNGLGKDYISAARRSRIAKTDAPAFQQRLYAQADRRLARCRKSSDGSVRGIDDVPRGANYRRNLKEILESIWIFTKVP